MPKKPKLREVGSNKLVVRDSVRKGLHQLLDEWLDGVIKFEFEKGIAHRTVNDLILGFRLNAFGAIDWFKYRALIEAAKPFTITDENAVALEELRGPRPRKYPLERTPTDEELLVLYRLMKDIQEK